jgi:hypothetical protein
MFSPSRSFPSCGNGFGVPTTRSDVEGDLDHLKDSKCSMTIFVGSIEPLIREVGQKKKKKFGLTAKSVNFLGRL